MTASANSSNQGPELAEPCQVCSHVHFSFNSKDRIEYEIDLSKVELAQQRNCPLARSVSKSKFGVLHFNWWRIDWKWCTSGEPDLTGVTFVHNDADKSSHIICIKEKLFSSTINFELPVRWLAWCQGNHSRCGPRYDGFKHPIYLIDCATRRLVEDDGKRSFIALSYVWGPSVANKTTWAGMMKGDVLSSLPTVVSDAMTVVRKMGYQYLWVDRYCINQDSPSSQIEQMDRIYGRAEFTIIAAAGKDADYGLPGVRSPSPTASTLRYHKVDDVVLVSLAPIERNWVDGDPSHDIRRSWWSSRAWTFQEGMLSRRRLFFTEDHVYFECAEMSCWRLRELLRPESELCRGDLDRPKELWERLGHHLRLCDIDEAKKSDLESMLRDVHVWIKLYSSRTLTFDEDSLNGFLGVLNYVEKLSEKRVTHLWGLPMLASCAEFFGAAPDVEASVSGGRSSMIHGLCWSHWLDRDREWLGEWELSAWATRRRPKFPSWSWAGWAGRAAYNTIIDDDQEAVRLLSTIHRVIPPNLGANSTAMLDIEAFFVPTDMIIVRKIHYGNIDVDFGINGFQTAVQPDVLVPAYEECVQKIEAKCWRICLLYGMAKDLGFVYGLLLARSSGTDVERYNRLGLVRADFKLDGSLHHFWKVLQDRGSRYERFLLE